MTDLTSTDVNTRLSAIRQLGTGNTEAVPTLIGFVTANWGSMTLDGDYPDRSYRLQDELTIKRAAIDALAIIGDHSTLPTLVPAVRDSLLGHSAVYALIKLADVKSLVEASKIANHFHQRDIYDALGKLGATEAVDRLVEVLSTPEKKNETTADRAAVALGQITLKKGQRTKVIDVLTGVLSDRYHSSVVSEAIKTLAKFDDSQVADTLISFLGSTFTEGTTVQNSIMVLKLDAAKSLAIITVTPTQYKRLESMVADGTPAEQIGGIYAMARLARPNSQETITAVIASENSDVSHAAIFSLRYFYTPTSISNLLNLIQINPDPEIRSRAGGSIRHMINECREARNKDVLLEISRQLGEPDSDKGGQYNGDSHQSTRSIKSGLRSAVSSAIEKLDTTPKTLPLQPPRPLLPDGRGIGQRRSTTGS